MKCASVRPALILPVLAPASIEMSIAHHDDNDDGDGGDDDDNDDNDDEEEEKQKNYQMFPENSLENSLYTSNFSSRKLTTMRNITLQN